MELELRDVVEHGDGVFSATLIHRYADLTAEQDFSAQVLTDHVFRDLLGTAGFGDVRTHATDPRWILVTKGT